MGDLVLFPHCDMHMALHGVGSGGTPALNVFAFLRKPRPPGDPDPSLDMGLPVTGLCTMEFFAPFNAVGKRFDNLPVFDPSLNLITATTPGVYLFEFRHGDDAVVGRLQVHESIHGWWFGNTVLTTAVHPTLAYTQPSIYASFTTDAGTDPVGDITGHDYVQLASNDQSLVVVNNVFNQGRLRGVSPGKATVKGTFMGTTSSLSVHVEDYDAFHPDMDEVHVPHVADAEFRHNMLFLGEGFQETERPKFDKAVTGVVDELFTKPRHEPYPLLKGSINVWKALPFSRVRSLSSRESHLTCGFAITELGTPIPEWRYANPGKYSVAALMDRVGLPRSDENGTRSALVDLWKTQGLPDFDASKVDDDVVEKWKALKPRSILQTQDTFLGFMLGGRLCDRRSTTVVGAFPPRGNPPWFQDNATPDLREFIKRLYQFYAGVNTTFVRFDPRRTPPELRDDSLFRSYMRSLSTRKPHPNIGDIGRWWLPDPGQQSRSKGLLCVLVNDYMFNRGTNNGTWIAFDLQEKQQVLHRLDNVLTPRIMKRLEIDIDFKATLPSITNTLAHEFGHSFGPGDEYELNTGDEWNFKKREDFLYDNLTRLGWVFLNGVVNSTTNEVTYANRKIDPARVKWFALERMQLSDALLAPAQPVATGVKLTIDTCHAGQWRQAKEAKLAVFLRETTLNHEQLPLPTGSAHFLSGLKILSVDEAAGTLIVSGSGLPPINSPVFQQGAVLFTPRLGPAPGHTPLTVVEPEVLDFLKANGTPLNSDTDNVNVNSADDNPVAIPHLRPPLQDFKLIGVYEGAATWAGATYRPAGACKMRHHFEDDDHAQFCYVCKWLIINRVDPTLLALLDAKQYPNSKHIP